MKKFWKSKTLLANIAALALIALQSQTGFVVSPELQATGLAIGNLILRALTGQPIDWSQVKLTTDAPGNSDPDL